MALQIRKAVQKDYAALQCLWPALDSPILPPLQQRWEKEMMSTSFVAENKNNKVVGYVCWTVTGSEGNVKYIMVDADCRHRGVATALLQTVAKELKERGCCRWRLHVRPDNTPAVALYHKFGLERIFGAAEVHLTWNCVSQLPATEQPVICCPVQPEEESSIEHAFDLSPGVFLEARGLGGRVPLQLRSSQGEEDKLLGCCIFDPAFPGAYPFCVAGPSLARSLLEEIQKSRDKAKDDFYLLVENQEDLVEFLVAAGAKVELHLDCFVGSF